MNQKELLSLKANQEIGKCSEEKINFEEAKPIFKKSGDYFIDRNKEMAKAIKELTHLNEESKIYGDNFKKIVNEHKRRCFFSPLKENAPYYSLKGISKKNNQAQNCITSAREIKKFNENYIVPISSE